MSNHQALLTKPIINQLTKTNVFLYYLTYSFLILYFIFPTIKYHHWVVLVFSLSTGMLIWSLIEYLTHRFIFHWKAKSPIEKIIIFVVHEVHHHYPKDVSRSITPLIITLPLVCFFYFLFKWVFGNYSSAIFSGFLMGYFFYTIIHDSTHHLPMKFSCGHYIKRHHMHHHYFDNTKNFGVTSPLWDYIFKTNA